MNKIERSLVGAERVGGECAPGGARSAGERHDVSGATTGSSADDVELSALRQRAGRLPGVAATRVAGPRRPRGRLHVVR